MHQHNQRRVVIEGSFSANIETSSNYGEINIEERYGGIMAVVESESRPLCFMETGLQQNLHWFHKNRAVGSPILIEEEDTASLCLRFLNCRARCAS